MGFFDKIFGGTAKSKSESGFSALPEDIQAQLGSFSPEITARTLPSAPGVIESFTPLGVTPDETTAFERLRTGVTPTAETLGEDISLQMDPFQQSVIDEVNRAAGGEFSVLKQALSEAGQFGSSRGLVGASDIEERRLGTIGKLKSEQFNKALQNALSVLPELRGEDIEGLLGIGGFERGLERETELAPVRALEAGTKLFSPFLTGGTTTSTGASPGILPTLASFVPKGG